MRTKRLAIFIVVGIFVLLLCILGWQKIIIPTKWQEQYDLGVRYLSEGNYQEAIIAFTAAIEIDKKRPEAYLQAVEAYKAIGDYDTAKEILNKGYNSTGDESLRFKDEVQELITDNFITPEELTVGGFPFYKTDIYTANALYPELGEIYTSNAGGYAPSSFLACDIMGKAEHGSWVYFTFHQVEDSDGLTFVGYHFAPPHREEIGNPVDESSMIYQPEFRGLIKGLSSEETLRNLGFSEDGIQNLFNILNNKERKDFNSFNHDVRILVHYDQVTDESKIQIDWKDIITGNAWENDAFLSVGWYNDELSLVSMGIVTREE